MLKDHVPAHFGSRKRGERHCGGATGSDQTSVTMTTQCVISGSLWAPGPERADVEPRSLARCQPVNRSSAPNVLSTITCARHNVAHAPSRAAKFEVCLIEGPPAPRKASPRFFFRRWPACTVEAAASEMRAPASSMAPGLCLRESLCMFASLIGSLRSVNTTPQCPGGVPAGKATQAAVADRAARCGGGFGLPLGRACTMRAPCRHDLQKLNTSLCAAAEEL